LEGIGEMIKKLLKLDDGVPKKSAYLLLMYIGSIIGVPLLAISIIVFSNPIIFLGGVFAVIFIVVSATGLIMTVVFKCLEKEDFTSIAKETAKKALMLSILFFAIAFTSLILGDNNNTPIDSVAEVKREPKANIVAEKAAAEKEAEIIAKRKAAFKAWALQFFETAKEIDEQWSYLDRVLDDNNLSRMYNNLDILQRNLEMMDSKNRDLKIPPELSPDHQKTLKAAVDTYGMGTFYRIKVIKLSKEYIETRKPSLGSEIIETKKKINPLEEGGANALGKVKNELNVEFD